MRSWELMVDEVSGPAILLRESDVVAHNAAARQLCRSLGYELNAFAGQARQAFRREVCYQPRAADSWEEFTWKRGASSQVLRGRLISPESDLLLLLAEPSMNRDVFGPSASKVKRPANRRALSAGAGRDVEQSQYKRAEKIARLGSYRIISGAGRLHVSRFLSDLLLWDVVTSPSSIEELLSAFDEDEAEKIRSLHSALMRGASNVTAEVNFIDKRGESLVLEIRCECDRDENGRPTSIYGAVIDVTQRVHDEQKVRFIAYHDALTELPNRAMFMQSSSQFLADAASGGDAFALHLIDLDGFKAINDSLGHLAGDQVLQFVAQRLISNIRSTDTAFRLGGDEFAILHRGIRTADCIERLGQRLADRLIEPMEIGGVQVSVGASMGGALYAEGETMQHMMLRADEMLYTVKRSGKGAFKLAA